MHSRGFTLVELLVVMTISAILVAVAVPSFQWTIARNRVSDATNQLLAHLEYARMESSRRGNTVSICRSADQVACSSAATAGADGNDWAVGWLVFEKSGGVDESNVEVGDQVIFVQQAMGAMTIPTVRVMIHSSSPGAEFFAYRPRGTGGTVGGAQTFAI
ncbi:MAG: GspH/FimT family pseudopilin, partial [Burkholderiaceae bacterium]